MSAIEQNPFLMLITDYKKPKSLVELEALTSASGLPRYFSKISITPDRLLDDKQIAWVFATDKWTETTVQVNNLKAHLPSFVSVSTKVKNTASVWDRILRGMERSVSYVAAENQRAFFLMESSSSGHYLITLDFKNKVWASSCPEYNKLDKNGDKNARFDICKHLASAIPYYRGELLTKARVPTQEAAEWQSSYASCTSAGQDYEANWTYFFIKEVIPKIGFCAGHYSDDKDVRAAIHFLEGKV
nr:hypothetical protein [Ferrimicrobium acidiphilum]